MNDEGEAACGFATTTHCPLLPTRRLVWAETALVFLVFFLQGAWPVPEVNEPYYLGKAIHYWNPDWVRGDFFLDSADTHKVFYFTFGWLSLWLPPVAFAWVGRMLTWGLLAWAWQRLSFAVLPRPWWSVLSAALLVCLNERCHMAGEWIVGGVEAKGFAFVLVLLGVEALVRNRWNRAWLLLGGAALFHVLVGGWSAVAAGLAWLWLGGDRPPLRSMWPGLLGGFVLSLPGLIPSLILTWGVDSEVVSKAHLIYVFGRLPHHLAPGRFPLLHVIRFVLLMFLWLMLCQATPVDRAGSRFRAFVAGAIVIGAVGVVIGLLTARNPVAGAALLRFYWFRLSDVAVPMGVALGGAEFVDWLLRSRPAAGKRWLAIFLVIAGLHVGWYAFRRPVPAVPRADKGRVANYGGWRDACQWIANSGSIPPDARFLTPSMSQTFKWYARRPEVVTWKDIPQDAHSIVVWWNRINDIHATGSEDPDERWHRSLAELGSNRLRQLGSKYHADYVLTVSRPRLDLDVVYANDSYVVYRLCD